MLYICFVFKVLNNLKKTAPPRVEIPGQKT